ncbi:hypothetical protein JCM6882_002477 [Rhodosporidiobolus microsporus]
MAAPTSPSQLPSLAPFLSHLASLVSSPACPSSLFIHAPTPSPVLLSTLTTTLTRVTTPARSNGPEPPSVEDLLPKVALVDLADVHSVKAAFDRVLDQLSGWKSAGEERWEDRNGGVEAWDGAMDGVRVVKREKKRKATAAADGRRKKRARLVFDQDEDGEFEEEDGAAEEGEENGVDEPEWTLEWNRFSSSSRAGEKPTLAPLRNTVEAFHHSLASILSFSTSSSSTSSAPPAPNPLDPASDLRPTSPSSSSRPARRFIVLERGELLSELAGGGGAAGGAARETGVGLTFASTMHRLGELTGLPITVITISRLPWRKARESMVGLPSPELLTFDVLADSDAVSLLTSRFALSPLSQPSSPRHSLTHAQLVNLFRSLASVVRTTFAKATTPGDEDELAYLCAKFWPAWKGAVERSNPPIAPTDTARLSIALKSTFAAELDRLALPRQSLSAVPSSSSGFPSSSSSSFASAAAPAPTTLQGFSGTIAAPPKQPTYLAPVPPTPEKNGSGGGSRSGGGGGATFFAAASSSAQATPTRPSDPNDPFSSSAIAGPSTPLRHQALSTSSAAASLLFPSSAAASGKKVLNPHASLASSLPIVARYILIAAYFAAVNPPKSDVRMFVRVDETEGVARKGKKTRKGGRKPGASPSKAAKPASLYGGKSFPYERLVAIFEAIVDDRREYTLGSVGVAGQVQTLLHLRLLTLSSSASNPDKILDGVKLRCPLAKDVVDALAVSVGWKEWRERVVGEE